MKRHPVKHIFQPATTKNLLVIGRKLLPINDLYQIKKFRDFRRLASANWAKLLNPLAK